MNETIGSVNSDTGLRHGTRSNYINCGCRCELCVEATREYRRDYYRRNRDKIDARSQVWKDTNREIVRARGRAYAARQDREARAERQRAYRAANVDKRRAWERQARERNRDRLLSYRAEWRERNREKLRQQDIEWREANRERFRATSRLASQRRRARLRQSLIVPFTTRQVAERIALWGGRCYVCGAPWEAIDHVKPISKGGAHCLANLRPICGFHNNRKKNKWRGVAWVHGLVGAGDVV